MRVEIESEHLNGVTILRHPDVFEDERGFFMEVFRADEFRKIGMPTEFGQDSHSRSRGGVVRGLHCQWEPPMGKLMRVTFGTAFLVAVDIRKNSPTLGKWHGITLSGKDKRQVWAPGGFARGFCVLSEYAEIQYKCTTTYNKDSELAIQWNDPDIGIEWPLADPILSEKDRTAPTLADWLATEYSASLEFKPADLAARII
jgi:dTDP-4-dehydrorhamnose 3,5-epimerase